MRLQATVIGLEDVKHKLSILPVRVAFSYALNRKMNKIKNTINKSIKYNFTTNQNPDSLATVYKSTKDTLNASITYKNVAHNLKDFDTQTTQIRNPNGSVTYKAETKIRRNGAYKSHTKKGQFLSFTFPGKKYIWGRHQQKTWSGGQRLRYSQMYGPSIAFMAMDQTVQDDLAKKNYSDQLIVETLKNY